MTRDTLSWVVRIFIIVKANGLDEKRSKDWPVGRTPAFRGQRNKDKVA